MSGTNGHGRNSGGKSGPAVGLQLPDYFLTWISFFLVGCHESCTCEDPSNSWMETFGCTDHMGKDAGRNEGAHDFSVFFFSKKHL